MFNPNYDLSTPEKAKASVQNAITSWNSYLTEAKASDINPLLQQMRDSKTAYFTALAALKVKAHEIAQEGTKLGELPQLYAPGMAISSVNIDADANPGAFIWHHEINAGKANN